MKTSVLLLAALFAATGCGGETRRRKAAPPPSPLTKALIRTAKSYLPEEDQKRPLPKDCSDYVGKVFAAHKVALPRSSEAMAIEGEAVTSSGDLRMGDLLFFAGAKGGRKIGHVALYVNNGIFIHQANPGEGVRQESLHSDYWRKRYLKARRIVE